MHITQLTRWHPKVIASGVKTTPIRPIIISHLPGNPFRAITFTISHCGSKQESFYPKSSALVVVVPIFWFSLPYTTLKVNNVSLKTRNIAYHVMQPTLLGTNVAAHLKSLNVISCSLLFSLFSMTRLGNTQKVVLSRCHGLLINTKKWYKFVVLSRKHK